jgi:hypothetical protein
MKKMLVIEWCGECSKISHYQIKFRGKGRYFCTKNGRAIVTDPCGETPAWCPLPDAKEKK